VAQRAKADGKTGVLVPAENAAEAAVVDGLQVIPVQNLREAAQFLEGEIKLAPTKVDIAQMFNQPHDDDVDFAEVKGQESVKRALEGVALGDGGSGSGCIVARFEDAIPADIVAWVKATVAELDWKANAKDFWH
jgi:predicted ATPase with chaperone activity